MQLKPQDTLILLKHWTLRAAGTKLSLRQQAESIGVSAGETSKGNKRLRAAGLLVERGGQLYPVQGAVLEWLSYGVRYAFPAVHPGYGRGMATGWNCKLLVSDMLPPSPAMVWRSAGGEQEGIFMQPVHDSVPLAASNDALLYQAFALVEVIRSGKPRELKIARELLVSLIERAY